MAPRTRRTTAAAAAAASDLDATQARRGIARVAERQPPPFGREAQNHYRDTGRNKGNARVQEQDDGEGEPEVELEEEEEEEEEERPGRRWGIRRYIEPEISEEEDDEAEAEDDPEPEPEQDASVMDDIEVGEDDDEEAQSTNDRVEATPTKAKKTGTAASSKPPSSQRNVPQPRLRIKLKLPQNAIASSSNSARTATPDDGDIEMRSPVKSGRRRPRRVLDEDIESEDPTSPSGSSDGGDERESESISVSAGAGTPIGPAGSAGSAIRPMTTRQAVLASVVDSSHVSLDEGTRSKKQPLTEMELALRREETARKRKNLSEKKLEDEKAETINRLLKKQTRPRTRRVNTTDDRSPLPSTFTSRLAGRTTKGTSTPVIKASDDGAAADDAVAADAEDDDEGMDMEVPEEEEEVKPTMFRWVSRTEVDGQAGENARKMVIALSVPTAFCPPTPASSGGTVKMKVNGGGDVRMDVPPRSVESQPTHNHVGRVVGQGPGLCAIEGCEQYRKYRLVRDWTIGACGLGHLRMLEATAGEVQ